MAAGRFRFGLLTRITLKDGEEIDLWSARDALVLKALTIVMAKHLPVSTRCTHLKGHGGAKAAVRQVWARLGGRIQGTSGCLTILEQEEQHEERVQHRAWRLSRP